MPRYMIVRSFDVGEPEMPVIGRRSREIVEEELPEITWELSHVVVLDDGKVRTFCVYDAPSEAVVRDHSSRLGRGSSRQAEARGGRLVTPRAVRARQQLVGNVADQHVRERELVLVLDDRARLAADQIATLELVEHLV